MMKDLIEAYRRELREGITALTDRVRDLRLDMTSRIDGSEKVASAERDSLRDSSAQLGLNAVRLEGVVAGHTKAIASLKKRPVVVGDFVSREDLKTLQTELDVVKATNALLKRLVVGIATGGAAAEGLIIWLLGGAGG